MYAQEFKEKKVLQTQQCLTMYRFNPSCMSFLSSPSFFLQGEQCNIVPDNIDDIVADLAPEEKEEGTFEISLCIANNLYFVPFPSVICR